MKSKLSLLAEFASETVEWAEPAYDTPTESVVYIGIERERLPTAKSAILEGLWNRDLLEREFADRLIVCPDCGSDDLTPDFCCPACNSANTVDIAVFEHTDCGCVRPQDAFDNDDSYSCPKCGDSLATVDDGCERMGTMHQCEECDTRSDVLDHRLNCSECGSHTPDEARTKRLYRYRFNTDHEEWLNRLITVRDAVKAALDARDYNVHQDGVLTDASGDTFSVDLTATHPTDSTDLAILIRDTIDETVVADLAQIAEATQIRPLLATTLSGTSDEEVDFATEEGFAIVWIDSSGSVAATENFDRLHGFRTTSAETDPTETKDSATVVSD